MTRKPGESDDVFLKRTLTSYREPDKTRREVLGVIGHYKGLKPIYDSFVFNNGTSKQLLSLKGTIPVTYRGAVYHIPVVLWLLDTHPHNAPMVFVTPTSDMRIKVSRHVDHNGKVYLPYLHDWNPNESEILDLIQVMIITFGEQPPVYAVQAGQPPVYAAQAAQPPVQQPMQPPYPAYPAYPMNPGGGMPMPMPGSGMMQQHPPQVSQYNTPNFSVRPSLISAAEEKLKRRLEDMYLSTEIIRKTQEELQMGASRLEMMSNRLQEERKTLESNVATVEKECAALDAKITASQQDENEADIDDAIQAPTPLHKQILATAAEEAALDDTIYYLGQALQHEKIDLDSYLRTVRQVSRKQFTQRALLRKCRQRAGLAG